VGRYANSRLRPDREGGEGLKRRPEEFWVPLIILIIMSLFIVGGLQ
jgi:hypothetical protein